MPSRLTPRNSLDNLKREAKRWLKAIRANVADARARFERAHPDAPSLPTLRDVQHALAREHGFPGWGTLKTKLAESAPAEQGGDALLALFLDNACPDHHVRGGPDHLRARHTAMRLLAHRPALARASFQTAVVCGDLPAVQRMLAERPELASVRDGAASAERSGSGGSGDLYSRQLGPKGWEPLLYLCFTRLPLPAAEQNAVAIARALLDAGADPNAHFMAGGSRYTPLVGAIGEGEEARPAHPQRDALVRLLLERGAGPYDGQVVYNIHFHGDALWFLELMYERAVQLGLQADWDDPEWSMFDMGGYGSGARWHLDLAVQHGDVELAEWCLAHGANANAAPARDPRFPRYTLYEEAVRRGQPKIADLLLRHGAAAVPVVLSAVEEYTAACLRLDRDGARTLLAAHPELVRAPEPLAEAARRNRTDVVELLLELGTSPDVASATNARALHAAAHEGSLEVARLLIARGAEVDAVESNWNSTPLGAAIYAQRTPMIDLFGRYSRDLWELVYAGKVDRVAELLADQPELARVSTAAGSTPLMWLPPDDEARATAIARLLLEHGADAAVLDRDGMTAAERAERIGMFDLAELLRAAAAPAPPGLQRFERMAANLLEAYRTGTPEAMERHWNDTWHHRSWLGMRRYVQLDLGREPEPEEGAATDDPAADITLDDARWLVAREQGFESWAALTDDVIAAPIDARERAVKSVRLFRSGAPASVHGGAPADEGRTRDWAVAFEMMRDGRITGLDAEGQMTDELLARFAALEHVTALRLGGSVALTDEGLRQLARMPQLRELDLGGCRITDRGLAVLRELPALEKISLWWTGVTDAGVAHLAACEHLERVDLAMTATGDGALRALAGKEKLRHLRSGGGVTDAGLPLLHQFPVFERWQGGDVSLALLSPDAEPNSLMLRGTFTDRGMAQLAGLDGLFALNLNDTGPALSAAALAPLVSLPRLGFLAFDATDEAMPYIAAMPSLRFLLCQDTTAGDDGFVALSRSSSIEYIWGRRCLELRRRGFEALAEMPALRSMAVSCLNVGDAGLAVLPRFPALRELMPMDVPDAGYRHIGQCAALESLILMYCRNTTDAATEQIVGLPRLSRYFASYTRITDRTPELLADMPSLESVELAGCPGVTNAGVAALARLPRLRELRLSGLQRATRASVAAFPAGVRVEWTL